MIYLDTETFSATPIRDGTYKYAANCEVDIISYAVDGGFEKCGDPECDVCEG